MRAALTFGGRTLAWVVIVGAAGVVLVAVLIPRITGAAPYTILTSSMSPAYPPGTLVVVRPIDDVDDLDVGDVVTVQRESGQETMVTHRISAVSYALDGDVEIETKGDANSAPDRELRLPVQIRGELWYAVPYLGYVSTALSGGERQWIVTTIAIGLLTYAAWMFISAWRSRNARLRDDSAAPAPGAAEDEERAREPCAAGS